MSYLYKSCHHKFQARPMHKLSVSRKRKAFPKLLQTLPRFTVYQCIKFYFLLKSQQVCNSNFLFQKLDCMVKIKLSLIEVIVLATCIVVLAVGYFLFYTNVPRFEKFVQEDGIAEWLTVAGLLPASFVSFYRVIKLFNKRSKWFLFVTLCLGLFLFFSSGEEISWGQRIFGIQTPEYFEKHNAQQEMNLHNLVVGGVKINKLFFSFILVGALCIYLVIVPLLYQKNNAIKKFINASGVPVPRLYQVIGFLLVFALTSLIPHGKQAELLECDGALLFFLIILYPKNKEIFIPGRSLQA